MNGLSDALTVGVLLTLIFGAVSFYLWSRISQAEKRVSLLEDLLMTLKINTEASLMGPDSVEAISNPGPLNSDEIEQIKEEDYAELLKEVAPTHTPTHSIHEEDEEELEHIASTVVPKLTVNYESMSVKELQALVKERGMTGIPNRKAALIDALKKQGGPPPSAPSPLAPQTGDLEGADGAQNGFTVDLEETQ